MAPEDKLEVLAPSSLVLSLEFSLLVLPPPGNVLFVELGADPEA